MQQFTQRFQQKIDIFGMRRMPHQANTPYLSAQVAQARPDFQAEFIQQPPPQLGLIALILR